ncbi:MAG: Alpha/beta hydrolase family [Paenibacillus sp.]|jgi:predicted alpha/beta hydrolase family esterase|uniref:alpha/beta hydrolase n=1 Tax=Paenibacillus sp. GCM10012303 TaxID=3317340 RepID=UPI0029F35BF5|nr:Alpha/beta hydrolase family [Paenibacillus sp.]
MKKQLLFIQGGGQGAYAADLKLAANLQALLGFECDVLYPKMPDEGRPVYGAWKARIAADLSVLEGEAILIGHSLGASFVMKYLTEEKPSKPVAGVFLLAAPYWGAEDWEVEEYALGERWVSAFSDIQPIYLYHSRDDEIVPFTHLERYAERFPEAIIRKLDGRGHQFNNDLFEVAQVIKTL